MTIDKLKDFNKRWNITQGGNEDFEKFKNRILIILDKVVGGFVLRDHKLVDRFAFNLGIKSPPRSAIGPIPTHKYRLHFIESLVYKEFANSQTIIELAKMLQTLFCTLEDDPNYSACIDELFLEVQQAIEIGSSINVALSKSGKSVSLYPVGAKLLDDGIVNDSLTWLQECPGALNAFEQALSIYLSGDKPKYRNLIDNLRIALELVLKFVLGNQKSLENQNKELDDWLQQNGVNKQIRNLYGQLLFGPYTVLQNDVAKHGDRLLLNAEIEYLIYQTGTFMRLLLQLHRNQS
jgi:hypothetical protein